MTIEIQKRIRTCAITGASGGIGKATAIELAKQGYDVIMIVRNGDKSRKALEEIKTKSGSENISIFYADLASFNSIRDVASAIKKQYATIDILINNAGLFTKKHNTSADGFELTLAVNYLAPFLLTNLLLPNINKNDGRIINLSSEIYKRGTIDKNNLSGFEKYNAEKVYADSKMLINYFTQELARRLADENIVVNCVHPGVVGTDVFREYPKWFNTILNLFISKPEDGAKPVIQLATIPKTEKISGKYFKKMKETPMAEVMNDTDLSNLIWKKSLQLTNLR
jgi:NAD(P)-dependent dehydrogenase (short-subunit alcohol dehydrogenase family)